MSKSNAWAVLAITEGAVAQALAVKKSCPEINIEVFTLKKYQREGVKAFSGGFRAMMQTVFNNYETMLCIMATGVVIRGLATHLVSKQSDPAVLVMDEAGQFVISLLSGHLGGANQKARWLANRMGATPVITTASDVLGKTAVDTLAKKLDCAISDMQKAKEVTALIVNDKPVVLVIDDSLAVDVARIPPDIKVDAVLNDSVYQGAIYLTPKIEELITPTVRIIPRVLVVGIGCRRGMPAERIIQAVESLLDRLHFDIRALKKIATVDIKKNESGIFMAAKHWNVPVEIISRQEIATVEDKFECSDFVRKTIGVGCVADPCGYISSTGGRCLCRKIKAEGITLSLWQAVMD